MLCSITELSNSRHFVIAGKAQLLHSNNNNASVLFKCPVLSVLLDVGVEQPVPDQRVFHYVHCHQCMSVTCVLMPVGKSYFSYIKVTFSYVRNMQN